VAPRVRAAERRAAERPYRRVPVRAPRSTSVRRAIRLGPVGYAGVMIVFILVMLLLWGQTKI